MDKKYNGLILMSPKGLILLVGDCMTLMSLSNHFGGWFGWIDSSMLRCPGFQVKSGHFLTQQKQSEGWRTSAFIPGECGKATSRWVVITSWWPWWVVVHLRS